MGKRMKQAPFMEYPEGVEPLEIEESIWEEIAASPRFRNALLLGLLGGGLGLPAGWLLGGRRGLGYGALFGVPAGAALGAFLPELEDLLSRLKGTKDEKEEKKAAAVDSSEQAEDEESDESSEVDALDALWQAARFRNALLLGLLGGGLGAPIGYALGGMRGLGLGLLGGPAGAALGYFLPPQRMPYFGPRDYAKAWETYLASLETPFERERARKIYNLIQKSRS